MPSWVSSWSTSSLAHHSSLDSPLVCESAEVTTGGCENMHYSTVDRTGINTHKLPYIMTAYNIGITATPYGTSEEYNSPSELPHTSRHVFKKPSNALRAWLRSLPKASGQESWHACASSGRTCCHGHLHPTDGDAPRTCQSWKTVSI